MELKVLRYSDNGSDTLGLLFVDGQFNSYTLEDEHRDEKVRGDTRIPEGRYQIVFRKEGGFHSRYANKYGSFHKGMLHIINVPNFEYILIHTGNHEGHTAGCLLVGDSANDNSREKGFIGSSVQAYKEFYPKVAEALECEEEVWITYVDLERLVNTINL